MPINKPKENLLTTKRNSDSIILDNETKNKNTIYEISLTGSTTNYFLSSSRTQKHIRSQPLPTNIN